MMSTSISSLRSSNGHDCWKTWLRLFGENNFLVDFLFRFLSKALTFRLGAAWRSGLYEMISKLYMHIN